MSYINFDKNQLINLEYSLKRELIRSNTTGSYASTTIVNCNTRKYHGLLITPQPEIDFDNHVLLSNLDETIIQKEAEFNLAIHMYDGGVYDPKGHKYIRDFSAEPIPKLTYRVGNVVLTKEMLFACNSDRILIRYSLEDAYLPVILRLKPFLAFRNVHKLSTSNIGLNNKYKNIRNGIKIQMYKGYSYLNMQFSKATEYTHVPHWYYNIEYIREKERGYEFLEDLYVPGFFEVSLKKGESVVFAAGLEEINPVSIKRSFYAEIKKRIHRNSFENCLINSAKQFLVKKGNKTEIIAGFPWFGSWGRDTFISLPGLTLTNGDIKTCKSVIDTLLENMQGPLFPNCGESKEAAYNSVDAPLWFFWALQQYAEASGTENVVWKNYGKKMQLILNGFRNGTDFNIKMQENGLIFAGEKAMALTWMDAIVDGKPVTPRIGYAVEINALWYNAVMFSIEMAKLAGDEKFINNWSYLPEKISNSFKETFWNKEKAYLADYVNGDYKDWAVRPNQVFATSLKYCPIDQEIQKSVLDTVESELLTPRGLRTLSPKNSSYKGTYKGNQKERDLAYHQGIVWPWLLGHFAEGYLKIHGAGGIAFIKSLFEGFENVMTEAGIGTISEVYDGDPPYKAGGAISQAWSVAELLRINQMIKKYS
ncbi:MAG: glycogen debranching enzyme family protein [Bacteroidetes bacterium]|nr:glycogen debranching enzyme family protein [Bacteroidota bacterium]